MVVVSKRNIILPGPNGERFHMPRDFVGPVPAWAEKSAYFKALVEDGKVIVSESRKKKGPGREPTPPEEPPTPPEEPSAGEAGGEE